MDTEDVISSGENGGADYSAGGASDKGPTRSENQDAFWIPESGANSKWEGLFLVADGVGGQEGGADAAKLAVETARQVFFEIRQDGAVVQDALKTALERANQTVFEESQRREVRRMGATFVAAAIEQGQLFIAHVGDARAYLTRQGEMIRLTRDDTWVQKQVEEGWISEEQAANHEYRNVVTQVLGNKAEVNVHLSRAHDLQQDDVILLCSDGLYGSLSESQMLPVLSGNDPQFAADQLITDAIEAQASDNITAVVVKIKGTLLPAAAVPITALPLAAQPTIILAAADEPTMPLAMADEPTLPTPAKPAAPLPAPDKDKGKTSKWLIILAISAVILIIAAILFFWLRSSSLHETVQTAVGSDMTAAAVEVPPTAESSGALKPLPTKTVEEGDQASPLPTEIPPATPTLVSTPTLEATPEPRGCINNDVIAFVWTQDQLDAGNCVNTILKLENGDEVRIFDDPAITAAGSCNGLQFIKIQSLTDPELEGWVSQLAIDRLDPGQSCTP